MKRGKNFAKMNYLRISNTGLICPEDLMLIGSSTKRDQTNKIGMFGSGWKYALSWLLRNDCSPRIFSGKSEIEVDSNIRLHRDNPVNVITINGQESSLTTQMGPKWTGWMALREVISNAIDEGNHSITTQWSPEFGGVDNDTVIFIPMNHELAEVMMKYDMYFAFNRKENYRFDNGRIFVKKEDSQINVYRRGIRCFDEKFETKLDFDLFDVDINEDRLCNQYHVQNEVKSMVNANTDPQLLKMIIEEGTAFLPYNMNTTVLECMKSLINSGTNFTTSSLMKLGGAFLSGVDALIIPAEWYKKLSEMGLIENPFEMLDADVPFIRTNGKDTSGVKYYIKSLGIDVEVVSGACTPDAFFRKGMAYVKENTQLDDKRLAARVLSCIKAEDWEWYLK